jgi:hypothetical protein
LSFQSLPANVFCIMNANKFELFREGGETGVRGGADEKEEM